MATGDGIVISDIVVGPGTIFTGAVIEDWKSYTPTVNNLGAGSSTNDAQYQRVGSSLHVVARVLKDGTPGSGGSGVTISLPSGLTADVSKMSTSARVGTGALTVATYGFEADVHVAGNNLILRKGEAATNILGSDMSAGSEINLSAIIPIAEWAGSGTVNLGEITNAARRTKDTALTVTCTNFTQSFAKGFAFCDSTGKWKLNFNFAGTFSPSAAGGVFTIAGVTFDSTFQEPVYSFGWTVPGVNGTLVYGYTSPGSSNINAILNESCANITVSGECYLDSKPAWADANMETNTWQPVGFGLATSTSAGLLSKYEEGTWTPAFYAPSGSLGLTGQTSAGTFIRVGNKVSVTGTIYYTGGTSGMSGALSIADLPFTNRNTAGDYAVASVFSTGFSVGNVPVSGLVIPGTSRVELQSLGGPIDSSAVGTYDEVYFSATYFI
jgi:hypothetical protein